MSRKVYLNYMKGRESESSSEEDSSNESYESSDEDEESSDEFSDESSESESESESSSHTSIKTVKKTVAEQSPLHKPGMGTKDSTAEDKKDSTAEDKKDSSAVSVAESRARSKSDAAGEERRAVAAKSEQSNCPILQFFGTVSSMASSAFRAGKSMFASSNTSPTAKRPTSEPSQTFLKASRSSVARSTSDFKMKDKRRERILPHKNRSRAKVNQSMHDVHRRQSKLAHVNRQADKSERAEILVKNEQIEWRDNGEKITMPRDACAYTILEIMDGEKTEKSASATASVSGTATATTVLVPEKPPARLEGTIVYQQAARYICIGSLRVAGAVRVLLDATEKKVYVQIISVACEVFITFHASSLTFLKTSTDLGVAWAATVFRSTPSKAPSRSSHHLTPASRTPMRSTPSRTPTRSAASLAPATSASSRGPSRSVTSRAPSPSRSDAPTAPSPLRPAAPRIPSPSQPAAARAPSPSQSAAPRVPSPSQSAAPRAPSPSRPVDSRAPSPPRPAAPRATSPSRSFTSRAPSPSQYVTPRAPSPKRSVTSQVASPSQFATPPAPSPSRSAATPPRAHSSSAKSRTAYQSALSAPESPPASPTLPRKYSWSPPASLKLSSTSWNANRRVDHPEANSSRNRKARPSSNSSRNKKARPSNNSTRNEKARSSNNNALETTGHHRSRKGSPETQKKRSTVTGVNEGRQPEHNAHGSLNNRESNNKYAGIRKNHSGDSSLTKKKSPVTKGHDTPTERRGRVTKGHNTPTERRGRVTKGHNTPTEKRDKDPGNQMIETALVMFHEVYQAERFRTVVETLKNAVDVKNFLIGPCMAGMCSANPCFPCIQDITVPEPTCSPETPSGPETKKKIASSTSGGSSQFPSILPSPCNRKSNRDNSQNSSSTSPVPVKKSPHSRDAACHNSQEPSRCQMLETQMGQIRQCLYTLYNQYMTTPSNHNQTCNPNPCTPLIQNFPLPLFPNPEQNSIDPLYAPDPNQYQTANQGSLALPQQALACFPSPNTHPYQEFKTAPPEQPLACFPSPNTHPYQEFNTTPQTPFAGAFFEPDSNRICQGSPHLGMLGQDHTGEHSIFFTSQQRAGTNFYCESSPSKNPNHLPQESPIGPRTRIIGNYKDQTRNRRQHTLTGPIEIVCPSRSPDDFQRECPCFQSPERAPWDSDMKTIGLLVFDGASSTEQGSSQNENSSDTPCYDLSSCLEEFSGRDAFPFGNHKCYICNEDSSHTGTKIWSDTNSSSLPPNRFVRQRFPGMTPCAEKRATSRPINVHSSSQEQASYPNSRAYLKPVTGSGQATASPACEMDQRYPASTVSPWFKEMTGLMQTHDLVGQEGQNACTERMIFCEPARFVTLNNDLTWIGLQNGFLKIFLCPDQQRYYLVVVDKVRAISRCQFITAATVFAASTTTKHSFFYTTVTAGDSGTSKLERFLISFNDKMTATRFKSVVDCIMHHVTPPQRRV